MLSQGARPLGPPRVVPRAFPWGGMLPRAERRGYGYGKGPVLTARRNRNPGHRQRVDRP
jgi:hypothetical protein